MADIKLIDAQGDERTYSGVSKVKIPLADGTGNATFIQPSGTKDIATNGTHDVETYKNVNVNVPNVIPDEYIKPSGTLPITANGTGINVKEYEFVDVQVEGGGTSGGECTGTHIIEVDTLPTENIDKNAVYFCDGKYYVCGGEFTDLIVVDGEAMSFKEQMTGSSVDSSFNTIPTKTVTGLLPSDMLTSMHFYYIEDEDDVFLFYMGNLYSMSLLYSMPYGGKVTDISEATTNGYYAMCEMWMEYASPIGTLNIVENGTYDVADKKKVVVNTPSVFFVQTATDLPGDTFAGSIAYVLGGMMDG